MLNGHLIGLGAVLFILGIVLADMVLDKNIRWLIAYPNWIYQKVEKIVQKFNGFLLVFLFIFVFNSINLFMGYVSGFLVILPFILAIWTGLNIGIILRETVQERNFLLLFLNPVALVELPAGWISFSLGMDMGMHYFLDKQGYTMQQLFIERLPVFFLIVLPLLAVSGLIESSLIRFVSKTDDSNTQDNQEDS